MPDSLDPLLRPRSVAVIGASRSRESLGGAILHNLLEAGFQGPVYPVNPNTGHVQSVPAYPDVESIPGDVDLAVIVIPAAHVLEAVEACGRKGVQALIVISAGFREIGPEGAERERELLEAARRHGMRLVGPNCLGLLNTDPNVSLNATFAPVDALPGRVAFSSQSGALGLAILDYARRLALGISQFVSVGNKADVSGNDLIEFWERDKGIDLILLYLESFGNPGKFTQIARRVARKKPIVAVKGGRSKSGARAASSHTGALAGSDVAVDALFHQSGVIRTDTIEELFDTALLLAYQPVPSGDRVAILTNAGGPGIMAADACESAGLTLPSLQPKTMKALRGFLAPEASVKNPVDMIASATAPSYEQALRLLIADQNVDAVIVIFVPPLATGAPEVARAILTGAAGSKKPILSCFMGSHGLPESLQSLNEGHIPSYAFPEAAARTLARVVKYGAWRSAPVGKVPELAGIDPDRARAAIEAALAGDSKTSTQWLDSDSIAKILAAYGIRTPAARTATNRGEAAVVAKSLGFPVVMKIRSADVIHKTDVGGVKLGLRTEEEAARAFDEIRTSLARTKPSARFEGVTLERMVTGGIETIVGMTRDPLFGPVLLFGLGGVAVELLRDVSVRVAPLTDRDADEMIRSIRSYPLLEGYRGSPPSNTASLIDLLHRVSHMATDHPRILEMDLNPVLVFPGTASCIALDVRIKIGRVDSAPEPEAELAGAAAGAAEAESPAPSSPRRR
ncbi:MAG: acetate--CoA ligase family protein [Candidatus Eisenbacteria bacterium]|uniref:Acetate--CoA ligase family protein n=1 Tax=Eiseniibacteriota bacterium TaxID=2212470 RepID=A0A538TUS6_UNCEI|nr:MAG: acetate--CoA ligase family protein [Candidatus Eisenbacteria bacterium]